MRAQQRNSSANRNAVQLSVVKPLKFSRLLNWLCFLNVFMLLPINSFSVQKILILTPLSLQNCSHMLTSLFGFLVFCNSTRNHNLEVFDS